MMMAINTTITIITKLTTNIKILFKTLKFLLKLNVLKNIFTYLYINIRITITTKLTTNISIKIKYVCGAAIKKTVFLSWCFQLDIIKLSPAD